MTITLNGSTGINTPGVVNTAAETIATTLGVTGVTTIAAGSAAAPALVGTTGGATTGVWFPAGNTIAFANGGVESARIDSSGNLLVGATSTIADGANTTSGVQISKGFLWFANSDATYFQRLTSDGSVQRFLRDATQVGSITVTASTTAYNTSSDYRLKEAIAPMTGALAKVALLKPCTYKWKVDGSDGQGFIAHELQEVVEGCVTGTKDATREEQYEVTPAVKDADGNVVTEAVMGTRTVPDYQGIDTSFLVATLTAAIQELNTRLTALENK